MKDENGVAQAGGSTHEGAPAAPLQPPVLGMVGGGYRTRLTAQAAVSLGIGFRVLAGAADDSAAQVAPGLGSAVGDYRSAGDLLTFASGCEILTFEPEDVPEELLAKLAAQGAVAVRPNPAAFAVVRDKAALRDWLGSLGLKAAGLAGERAAEDRAAEDRAAEERAAEDRAAEDRAAEERAAEDRAAEERAAVDRELAVVAARSPEGQGVTYPVTLMLRRHGERREFIAPAPGLDPDLAVEAQRIALKIAAELRLTGLLTVELAESGGTLSVLDLAVTPHDSCLWTMDAAVTSAFEQNLRAVLDLPFGTPSAVAATAVTVTVVGGDDPDVFTRFVHVMAADSGARVHIYTDQVSQIRPGVRIGHVTVAGDDLEGLRDRAWRAANYLGLGTEEPNSPT